MTAFYFLAGWFLLGAFVALVLGQFFKAGDR